MISSWNTPGHGSHVLARALVLGSWDASLFERGGTTSQRNRLPLGIGYCLRIGKVVRFRLMSKKVRSAHRASPSIVPGLRILAVAVRTCVLGAAEVRGDI